VVVTTAYDADNSEPSAADLSLERRFFNWRTGLSFALALAILVFVLSRLDIRLDDTVAVLRRTQLPLYLLVMVVYYSSFPLRALRWKLMLKGAGYRDDELPKLPGLAEIIFISWFANCLVPAKLGDLYRAYLLKRVAPVSFSRVTGTVLGERVVDFAVLLSIMAGAGVVAFHAHFPPNVVVVLAISLAAVAVAGVVLLMMRHYGAHLERLLPGNIRPMYGRFAEGTLGSLQQLPAVAVLSAIAWLLEAGRFFLVLRSLNITLSSDPYVEAGLVLFLGLGSALLTVPPGTPGGLGYVETGITAVLIWWGREANPVLTPGVAISITLLDRSLSYASVVLFGALVYARRPVWHACSWCWGRASRLLSGS
jgi:hypothetical protein